MATTASGARILPFPQGVNTPTGTEDGYYYYNNKPKHDYETSLKEVEKAYHDCFCGTMPQPIRNQVLGWIHGGVQADLITAILEYTVCTAPRPSWAYAAAVMRAQLLRGYTVAEQFTSDCREHQAERRAARALKEREGDGLPY